MDSISPAFVISCEILPRAFRMDERKRKRKNQVVRTRIRKRDWRATPERRKVRTRMALSIVQFNRLVDDHRSSLYRMACRLTGDQHVAEDIVQETFRSAWNSRGRFRAGASPRAWLSAILRRRSADYWRRQPQARCWGAEPLREQESAPFAPWQDGYSDEMKACLEQLPAENREAMLLVVAGELTHQEAARKLDVPLGTVLSRVSRGRNKLRQLLIQSRQAGLPPPFAAQEPLTPPRSLTTRDA